MSLSSVVESNSRTYFNKHYRHKELRWIFGQIGPLVRLTEMYPGAFERLRLFALDPYDIALSKIERNIERDREDVKYLASAVPLDLDLDILQSRYNDELRPYLGIPEREDLTLKLWIEMIEEIRRSDGVP